MADNKEIFVLTQMSEFTRSNDLNKQTDIIALQDGKNVRIDSEVISQQVINKVNPKFIERKEKGQPNGVATLDENGKVPSTQLPPLAFTVNETPIDKQTPTPTQNGVFLPTQIGVYPNFGGLEYTQQEFDNNDDVRFIFIDGRFEKQVKSFGSEGEINSADTRAVGGDKVYDYTLKEVKTIAELRTVVGEENQTVRLLGYYEVGDKPPLLYKWVSGSGTDDGGSIIVSSGGYWSALFGERIYIEDFGISENTNNNAELLEKCLKIQPNILKNSLENKTYIIEKDVNVINNLSIELGLNTTLESILNKDIGSYPNKIINVNGVDKVSIKGNFSGGYKTTSSVIEAPKNKVSSLLNITNVKDVYLEIDIKEFASNWSNTNSDTIDNLLDYGAIHVRKCINVVCHKSSLTKSRIEGFVFLENKFVKTTIFSSKDNIGIWTPIHMFLNYFASLSYSEVVQNKNSDGSTVNLYNTINHVHNNYIENGEGVDHSWEVGKDATHIISEIKRIDIVNNDTVNCKSIFYSLYHNLEVIKNNVNVIGNTYTYNDVKVSTVTGINRIDFARNINVKNNIAKSTSENHYFLYTAGGIENVNLEANISECDAFFVARLGDNSRYNLKGITLIKNTHNSLPIGARDVNREYSSFCFVNNTNNSDSSDLNIIDNDYNVEGRAVQITSVASKTIDNIKSKLNRIDSNGNNAFTLIGVKNIELSKNLNKDSLTYCVFGRCSGDLSVSEDVKQTNTTQTKEMYSFTNCNFNDFIFKNNKYKVPNPNTWGIIGAVSNSTYSKKHVCNNSPNVLSGKTYSDSCFGTTADRPNNSNIGHKYFDITLSKPIYWNGTKWVDSQGANI